MNEPRVLAQQAMADLKAAICSLLKNGPNEGMRNAEIGRTLGILTRRVRHEAYIPRILLALMEREGLVQQDAESKLWRVRTPNMSASKGAPAQGE